MNLTRYASGLAVVAAEATGDEVHARADHLGVLEQLVEVLATDAALLRELTDAAWVRAAQIADPGVSVGTRTWRSDELIRHMGALAASPQLRDALTARLTAGQASDLVGHLGDAIADLDGQRHRGLDDEPDLDGHLVDQHDDAGAGGRW